MEENFDSYNEEEDYAAAVNRFEKMLSNNQNYFFDVEEFEDLINYYLDINDHEKAEKALNFSLNQHPDSVTLKIKLAEFLASTYKPNKALEILSSVEHIEPFNPDIHIIKGQIYNQIRQHNKAIEAYKKALRKNPNDEAAKYNLSYARAMLKKQEGGGGSDNKQDQNKEDKQDQDQNQQNNNQDEQKDQQEQQQDQSSQNNQQEQQEQQEQKPQPQPSKLTEQQAEQLLNALAQEEKKLHDKKDKQKGTPVNREKDW